MDGVFRSKLGVILMQEQGPHEKTKRGNGRNISWKWGALVRALEVQIKCSW